jgi:hypothetical protein
MFDVEVCESRRIVLVVFRGEVTEADFTELDARGRAAQGGPGYDAIYDLSRIEKAQLGTELVDKRGRIPQAFKDRLRLYVVPQPDLKLLIRLYAAYQQAIGSRPPTIVDTLNEAFEQLGVSAADFQPLPRRSTDAP